MTRTLIATLIVPVALSAQAPDNQRTGPQTLSGVTTVDATIAAEFAANDMPNAVAALLVYPSLARRIFTHDRYRTTMYAGLFNSLRIELEPGLLDRLPSGIPVTISAKRTNRRSTTMSCRPRHGRRCRSHSPRSR